MALGVTTSADILVALKTYYGDQYVANLLFRNSPLLRKIKKLKIGGKQYPLPMLYSRGGAVSGSYTIAETLAVQNYGGKEMNVLPGQIFAPFIVDPKEYLSSQTTQGAWMSLLALKAFAALEALRKTLAMCLYGKGYGEMGTLYAVDSGSHLYVDVVASVAMGVDIGSNVLFTSALGTAPRSATPSVVQSIQTLSTGYVRITFASATVAGVVANDWMYLYGGVDASYGPNMPMGLNGWLPWTANRTTAAWTTEIGTAFFGVDRSSYPDRLAGGFVLRNTGASEKYAECVSRAVKQARRQGSVPDLIVLNDDNYQTIINELQAQRNFFQQINTSGQQDKNKLTSGLSQIQFAFSTNFLEYVIDDPYCPLDTFYVLESDAVMFLGLSNVNTPLNDGVQGNDPGAPKTTDASEPTTNYQFLVDEYYTTKPVSTGSGTGIQVDFNLFGSFAVSSPAHCVVGRFN